MGSRRDPSPVSSATADAPPPPLGRGLESKVEGAQPSPRGGGGRRRRPGEGSSLISSKQSLAGRLNRIFSFPVLLGVFLAGATFLLSRFSLLGSPDTWWHVAVGKHILATHTWPTTDTFSFTARGADWIAYEWLGEVAMALASALGGLQALAALLFVWSAALVVLLYYYAFLRSGSAKAALVSCLLFLPITQVFFQLRGQLPGYVFFLITLICLERFRLGRQKTLWILPFVFLLWVNTHGTFVFGLGALGLYWASGWVEFEVGQVRAERWTSAQSRHLAWVSLFSTLALLVTPYGARVAAYPLQMALSQPVNVASINEWQPLGFQFWQEKLLLVAILGFFLAQLAYRPRYRVEEVALLLFFLYSAFVHLRFVLPLLIVFTPLVAELLARALPDDAVQRTHHALNAALMAIVVTAVVLFFPSNRQLEDALETVYPRAATAHLRQHPVAGPLLNDYAWGGFLMWESDRPEPVFIDGRADIYEYGGVLADYDRIMRLDGSTPALLRRYGIGACLVAPATPFAIYLSHLPGWEPAYQDHVSSLFVRSSQLGSGAPAVLGSGAR
jgi:hypothetical protein